jgi:hypothetical protein
MDKSIIRNYEAFQTKREIQLFTRKVYRFLHANHTIEFKYLRTCRGRIVIYENPATLELDKRDEYHLYNNPVTTFIHEVLHFVYPDASETWVLKMEPRIFKQLSKRQISYLETLLISYM